MLMHTLAISCLTTSNLPLFIDLTFQVPMKYCSVQYRTLLLQPGIAPDECRSYSDPLTSFLLELLVITLNSFPVAYWTPSNLGVHLPVSSLFCLFKLSMVFSRQEYWSGLPFPSPADRILLELSTMTHLSWVSLHSAAHRFIELSKHFCHDKAVIHEEVHD